MSEQISITVPASPYGLTLLAKLAYAWGAPKIKDEVQANVPTFSMPEQLATSTVTAESYAEEEKPKRHRRTKAEIEAERAGAKTDTDDYVAEAGVSDDVDDLIKEKKNVIDAGEIRAKSVTEFTLEKHVIPAFQTFVKSEGRDSAIAVLTQFKVKSVRDIPSDKYGELMAALK